jgi:hypothetical protein
MGKWLYDAEEDDVNAEDTVSKSRRSGGEDNLEDTPRVQA